MSRQIAEVPTRTFEPGTVIFREGDDAKGELLGHLALFRNVPRSASAIAADAVTLMVISANRLDHLVRANSALAVALIRDLAAMLLSAEDRLREVENKLTKQ